MNRRCGSWCVVRPTAAIRSRRAQGTLAGTPPPVNAGRRPPLEPLLLIIEIQDLAGRELKPSIPEVVGDTRLRFSRDACSARRRWPRSSVNGRSATPPCESVSEGTGEARSVRRLGGNHDPPDSFDERRRIDDQSRAGLRGGLSPQFGNDSRLDIGVHLIRQGGQSGKLRNRPACSRISPEDKIVGPTEGRGGPIPSRNSQRVARAEAPLADIAGRQIRVTGQGSLEHGDPQIGGIAAHHKNSFVCCVLECLDP